MPESLERRAFLVRAALVVGLGIAGAENVVSPGARATAITLEGGHKLRRNDAVIVRTSTAWFTY
ncbi:MAG: twin-arginine translocation signal domain-containing protein, partial [Ilumatobacteraceae bacterium]